jgi:hypothetical protein
LAAKPEYSPTPNFALSFVSSYYQSQPAHRVVDGMPRKLFNGKKFRASVCSSTYSTVYLLARYVRTSGYGPEDNRYREAASLHIS